MNETEPIEGMAARHFIVYREGAGVIEVLRVLRDSRDLAQHLSPA